MYYSTIRLIFQSFPQDMGPEPQVRCLPLRQSPRANTGFPVLDPTMLKVSLRLSFQGH